MSTIMLSLLLVASAFAGYSPEVLSTDVAALQITSATHEVVDGVNALRVFVDGALGGDVTKLRLLFGRSVEKLTQCSELSLEAVNELLCKSLPLGVGQRIVAVERVNAANEVEARHLFDWSYLSPVVKALTGGADGLPIVVVGENFGAADAASAPGDEALLGQHSVEVFVGPYAAHSAAAPCVVADARGTEIRCAALPEGFGTQLHVTVCIDRVCGTSAQPLVDYPQPVVEAVRVVDGRVHMIGTGFGPLVDASSADAALEVEVNGVACLGARVVVAGREISCEQTATSATSAAAVDLAMPTHVVLARHGSRMTTLVKRQAPITLTSIVPTSGATEGHFALTLLGEDFGAAGVPAVVTIGGRAALNCATVERSDVVVVECESAPAGYGDALDVELTIGGQSSTLAAAFGYDAPQITSVSRADTNGGKIFVFGSNFGPSFAPVSVLLYIDGDDKEPSSCDVERNTHTRIQCDAPSGTGDEYRVVVSVGAEGAARSATAAKAFGYKRPDIHATTRPHWAGGHLYIRGHNFGSKNHKISVFIDHEECKYAELTKHHEEIRCRARPGAADGTEHTVKVRVDGQSSDKEGHSFHHMQFGNNAPAFDAHATHFYAIAGETLKIKLAASDKDGDELYFRGKSLPDGATWKRGFGYMQIEYNVPAGLLAYPHTEVNMTLEAAVTDGPDTTLALLHITARACPTTHDTCKDLTCVTKTEMCPVCPLSNVVRCGAARPILEPASGKCYAAHELRLSAANVAADAPVVNAGFSLAVGDGKAQRVALFSAAHAIVGSLEFAGLASFGGRVPAPQPAAGALVCAEVKSCDAWADARVVSRAVHVATSPALDGPLVVELPVAGLGIGPLAADGYGHCLARYDEHSASWHCVDESLTLRNNMLSGVAHADGCYAIVRDNCPDIANPDQHDSDSNGEGDLCSGGATLCEDCHDWQPLNTKYLQKFVPPMTEIGNDDCARNQAPVVIVTEEGDRYYSD